MKYYLYKLILAVIALTITSLVLSRVFSWVQPEECILLVVVMALNSFLAVYPLYKFSSKDPSIVYLWSALFRLFPLALFLALTAKFYAQNPAYYLTISILIYILFLIIEVHQLRKSTSQIKTNM